MKKVLYPILVIVLFLVVQSFAGIGVAIFGIIKNPDFFHQMNGIQMKGFYLLLMVNL